MALRTLATSGCHAGIVQASSTKNYDEVELAQALDAAGVLGLVAAGQLIAMSVSADRTSIFAEKMRAYTAKRVAA